ncbi:unnamed protein product [Linum trigynum]|uniref:Ubiquitinyl hydrolase 1 n=1 Tax=Linum trigynum TaxID=586398 RepID=A0AAV2F2Z7_9ROSI
MRALREVGVVDFPCSSILATSRLPLPDQCAESRNSTIDSLLRLLGEDNKDDVRFEGWKDMDGGGEGLWRWVWPRRKWFFFDASNPGPRQTTMKENRAPGDREGESITSSAFDADMGSTDPVSLADAGEEVAGVFDEIHFALIYDVLTVDG